MTVEESKAYDLKKLGEMMKAEGLEVLEDVALKSFLVSLKWFRESAAASPSTIDDIFAGLTATIEPQVKSLIDKIDGEKG